jgi:hypothetical protein
MPVISATSPGTGAHVSLGAVQAERLDLDHDMAGFGLGFGTILDGEDLGSSVLLDDDGAHGPGSL